jgi:hypothetical protein
MKFKINTISEPRLKTASAIHLTNVHAELQFKDGHAELLKANTVLDWS